MVELKSQIVAGKYNVVLGKLKSPEREWQLREMKKTNVRRGIYREERDSCQFEFQIK